MFKKSKGKARLNVYSNLTARRKQKQDAKSRAKAEYLATLPKHPVKRFFYRLHPKRLAKFWFSKRGGILALKITGITVLVLAVTTAGVFAYFRKDLDAIRPEELAKRVQTTITNYTYRDGEPMFEDTGGTEYKIVVDFDEISQDLKDATVALEDKDFYKHGGISFTGTIRAVFNNFTGGNTQGGSTLTQQLVKKVFFTEEEQLQRSGISGFGRKIKEGILAIEVERMYNKDQILNLYLNQVPYGGTRNGVESAAQAYFGKSAKDLDLAESSLLAGIPQNPSRYNPWSKDPESNKALIARQHLTLDNMVEEKHITKEEAEAAKKVFADPPTLQAKLRPQADQFANASAPHFVNTVKEQLTHEFGAALMGKGGLTIRTTLDKKAQVAAEDAIRAGAELLPRAGADNIAMTSVDVTTGQIIAMVGSVDFNNKEINGEVNAATSLLEPGSSVKIYDYAALFKERPGENYGAGSVLKDENIDRIYCQGNVGKCQLRNFSRGFYGDVTIRQSLASSLNIPAVKAMIIAGVDPVIQTARDMGNLQYCSTNANPTLSAAIGGGCSASQVGHTNAYATLARGGIYKPASYVLEVKNSEGQILKQWKDDSQKQALDPQVAYILSDILTDADARRLQFAAPRSFGFLIPNVKTASKTGTTDNGEGEAKDSWMMSYSPVVATGVWSGNHDGTPITSSNDPVRRVTHNYMERVHSEVYQPTNKWKPNDWFSQPAGIQKITVNGKTDLWPSWYKKPQASDGVKMVFDTVSRKKATDCTPARARQEVIVQKYTDPVSKVETLTAPDGFDPKADDDVHNCADVKPFVTNVTATAAGDKKYKLTASVTQGTKPLQKVEFTINGQPAGNVDANASGNFSITYTAENAASISVTVTAIDQALYDGTLTKQINIATAFENDESRRGRRPSQT